MRAGSSTLLLSLALARCPAAATPPSFAAAEPKPATGQAQPAAARPQPTAARPGPTATKAGPGAGAADSVLARAGGRVISRRAFDEAFAHANPATPPDSITPQARREFLQLLIDKELLAQAALRANPELTERQKAELRALRDNLAMGAVLDSLLAPYLAGARRAAAVDNTADSTHSGLRMEAGLRLRDSTLARLGVRYDAKVIERILPAWRALPVDSPDSLWAVRLRHMSMLPQVAPQDTMLVVATAPDDTVRVAELLRRWRHLSPLTRNNPRIESPDQLTAVVGNVIFERWLRRLAERLRMDQRPDIRSRLDEQREYAVVTQYVDRNVWKKIPQDSVTLRRYFDQHAAEWIVPAHVRTLRLAAQNGTEAESLASVLRDPARAESLLAQSARRHASLIWNVAVDEDSLRYAQLKAAGRGAVVGPLVVDRQLTVVRVLEFVAPRPRQFEEAQGLVLKAWMDREGERRMRALLADLRRRTPPRVRADLR